MTVKEVIDEVRVDLDDNETTQRISDAEFLPWCCECQTYIASNFPEILLNDEGTKMNAVVTLSTVNTAFTIGDDTREAIKAYLSHRWHLCEKNDRRDEKFAASEFARFLFLMGGGRG